MRVTSPLFRARRLGPPWQQPTPDPDLAVLEMEDKELCLGLCRYVLSRPRRGLLSIRTCADAKMGPRVPGCSSTPFVPWLPVAAKAVARILVTP